MLVLHHRIGEMLMHELSKRSPLVAVMHHQQVVALCDEIVRDERGRPVVVQCAFFVNRLLDDAAVGDDGHGPAAHFQGVQAAVLLSPFGESSSVWYLQMSMMRDTLRKGTRKVSELTLCGCRLWVSDANCR